ncbi:hypothetical protein [Pseudosulfitobacter koreensis]|uniref:J domain-containing protein n=1 Tax=Pseudosulfitobacter koreensis TaxID=2968472 RepID=A0ABT1Z1F4_9RHOB|nr:hypothetical protein [Pseudosulfitobacter koreense]MCR8826926.1 hypothetical protein [Pseudosulfitobacter koreense]
MSPRWPWSELGLAKPTTEREVKRAYAVRLKQIDRNDPAAFGALRDAFDAAKRQALEDDAAPNRPSMADIMEGRTGQDDAASVTLREPVRPTDTGHPPPQETTPDQEACRTKPQTDDTGHSPIAEEQFAQLPDPPKATLNPTTARPWGLGIGQLDALAQKDLDAALSIFQTKFNDALRPMYWDTKALDALLSLNMAHDLTLRRRLEEQLYDSLQSRLSDPETGYPTGMARVVETHFQWATDGVGASKRLGWRPDYQLLMYGHAQSLPQDEKAATRQTSRNKETYLWHKVGIFVVLYLLTISGQETEGAYADFAVFVALALIFIAVRVLTILSVAIIVKLADLLRLNRPAIRLAHWAFPATTAKLATSPEFRRLGAFVLTAVVLVGLYLIDKYA